MNNAPKEITEAPEGYEWTGELVTVGLDRPFAQWNGENWMAVYPVKGTMIRATAPGIRKIKPPTVMVNLPRERVEEAARPDSLYEGLPWTDWFREACRRALEQEGEE